MTRRFAIFVVIVLALVTAALSQTSAPNAAGVRILAPQPGQKLNQNVVAVRYELPAPSTAATSTPEVQLRLDDRDPIITRDTTHEFTGLTPGTHTVTVEVVDANRIPVSGSRTQVSFVVQADQQATRAAAGPTSGATPGAANQGDNLPSAASPLPLISIIGFGALVGGLASALKTR